jgi:hypothetical protein
MRANPVHRRGIASGKNQTDGERLWSEWSVSLPRYNRVNQMNHPALRRITESAVQTAVQQNAI